MILYNYCYGQTCDPVDQIMLHDKLLPIYYFSDVQVRGYCTNTCFAYQKRMHAHFDIEEDFVDCLGYTWWGPIDIVSSGTGEMKKRYGFVYVDMDDFGCGTGKRYKKKSFDYYRQVIASYGENLKEEM